MSPINDSVIVQRVRRSGGPAVSSLAYRFAAGFDKRWNNMAQIVSDVEILDWRLDAGGVKTH